MLCDGFYTYPQLTSGRSDEYAHRVAHRRHHSPPELASSPPSGEQREREREKSRAMKDAGEQEETSLKRAELALAHYEQIRT